MEYLLYPTWTSERASVQKSGWYTSSSTMVICKRTTTSQFNERTKPTMASVGDEQATGVVVCRSIVYGSIAFWQGKKAHEHHTHKWNSEFGPLWRVDALTPLAEPCPVPRAFFSRCGR